MPAIDALHELIKSLEQTEKRHFKIFAQRHILKGENQYLKLFDIIESMEEYEERSVKKRLGNTAFAKNLASSKNYLYNLILRSLRIYNNNRSVRTTLHELWLDAMTLIDKGLLKQATKIIQKAKKQATAYHYDIPLLEFMLMERKLIRRYTSNNANELILERQKESEASLSRIEYRLKMLDLYETMFLNYRNQSEARQSLSETIVQAEKLVSTYGQSSFEAVISYHYLCVNYGNLTRNHTHANYHLKQLIALQEQHPFLIDEDQEGYINTLNNYLNNCFQLQQLEEFPANLQKMRLMNAKSFKIRALIFQTVYYLEILYHLIRQEYQQVISIVPIIETGLKSYATNITKSRELTFYYNISIAFFLEKDYSNALAWINRILNEPKLEERQDIQSLARIFQLVIHFELKNYEFVESLISSANRYLIKKDKRHSAEFVIIRHLKEALYADKAEQQAIFQQLAADLQEEKGLEEIKIWVQERLGDQMTKGLKSRELS